MENQRRFLGQGVKFPLQVDPRTGKFAMVSQEEDIREAVGIILNTMRGERVMRPEFGSSVMDYVFAPSSTTSRQSMASAVQEQLQYQEPRIMDVEVKCRESNQFTGALAMEEAYTIRSTNSRYNHVDTFNVTAGSEGGGGA